MKRIICISVFVFSVAFGARIYLTSEPNEVQTMASIADTDREIPTISRLAFINEDPVGPSAEPPKQLEKPDAANQSLDPVDSPDVTVADTVESMETDESDHSLAEPANASIKSTLMEASDEDPLLAVERFFQQEAVDSAWAFEEENRYWQLFSDDSELSKYVLVNSECRSTSCRLTVNMEEASDIGNVLGSMVQSLSDTSSYDVAIGQETDSSEVTLFIQRGR